MPCLLCPSLLCSLLLLLPFPLASSCASKGDTVVITSSGPIKGKQFLIGSGSVTAYLGIPYAEPPVGNLRLQKPLSRRPWKETLEATSFGNSCPQFISDSPEGKIFAPTTPLSEDCLSLNIWVPHQQHSSPVPVLVWIHGGGFLTGASSAEVFNGAHLANNEKLIVASMNYRLGALGFLYLPPIVPGNLGLWDQQLALKWIKKNVAAFGGNPSRVTIFGQSAGAVSVHCHILAPTSQNLFAQAVMQSGIANAFWAWKSPEESKQISLELVNMLGCSKDNNISIMQCLQAKAFSEFTLSEIALFLQGVLPTSIPFVPTTDGEFLLDKPEKLMEEGRFQVKPIIMGETFDEAAPYIFNMYPNVPNTLINQEQLLNGIRMLVPKATEDVVQSIALRYSEGQQGPAQFRTALSQFFTDLFIACPLREAARNFRKRGSPVYAYSFTPRPSWSVWPEWIGASHAAEIPYVFGTLEAVQPFKQTYTEAESRLSRKMMHYWADFARIGNPNGIAAGMNRWPLYNPTKQNLFIFKIEPLKERVKHHCDFLKSLFPNAEGT